MMQHQRAVADHRVDRGPQLVAHRSVEPVARAHRLLEGNLAAMQLVVHLRQLGRRARLRFQQRGAVLELELTLL